MAKSAVVFVREAAPLSGCCLRSVMMVGEGKGLGVAYRL